MTAHATDPLTVIEKALSGARAVIDIAVGFVGHEYPASDEAYGRLNAAGAALASVRERERLAQAVVEAAEETSERWEDFQPGTPSYGAFCDSVVNLREALAAFRAHAEKETEE